MEQSFPNRPASTSQPNISNLPPGLSLRIRSQNSSHSRVVNFPASYLVRASQSNNSFLPQYQPATTLAGLSSLQRARQPFTFSPDPPASGPTVTSMASNQRPRNAVRVAVSAIPPAAARRGRRSLSSRPTSPETPSNSSPDALGHHPDPDNRRPTRSRKRTTRSDAPQDPEECSSNVGRPTKRPRRASLRNRPSKSNEAEQAEDSKPPAVIDKEASCCICMDEPKPEELAVINGCEHLFCFGCIEKWAERENSCPLCKNRFAKIDRVNKSKRKGGERTKNSKKVKQKDQRSDLAPGAALEGLLASFASTANFPPHRVARLIFSGMGGQSPFILSSELRRGGQNSTTARARSSLYDPLFSSDTDDENEDEQSFLPSAAWNGSSFADLFRGVPFGRGGPGIVVGRNGLGSGLGSFRPVNPVFDPPSGRSYASNSNDHNAGRQAENPLEIDDDSDDDDVEVVQVTRPM